MNLSEARQGHFARLIVDALYNDDLVDYRDDDEKVALKLAKKVLADWVYEEEEIYQVVCNKIKSLQREILEGTPEWDVLYQKYYEEEMRRRGY